MLSCSDFGILQWYQSFNIGLAYGSQPIILLGEMERKEKTPLCEGRKEYKLTKLLPRSVQSFQGELKKIRMEMGSPEEFGSRAKSRFSHGECEHATTHHDAQRS